MPALSQPEALLKVYEILSSWKYSGSESDVCTTNVVQGNPVRVILCKSVPGFRFNPHVGAELQVEFKSDGLFVLNEPLVPHVSILVADRIVNPELAPVLSQMIDILGYHGKMLSSIISKWTVV